MSTRRTWAVRALIGFGTVMLVAGCLGVWAKRQLLETDYWVDTSSAMLREPAIQEATAAYLADQVAQNATGERLAERLPDRLKPLAPQAAAALSELSNRIALRALESGAFQTLWQASNRLAHEQLVRVVEGETILGRAVVLDLRPMLGRLGERIGLGSDFTNRLPERSGVIQIVGEDEVSTIQSAAKLLRSLAYVTTLLAIAAFAAAIALARTHRRETLMAVGFACAGAGLFVLVVRRIAGAHIVDAVTEQGAALPAAEATWAIATSVLQDIGQAVVAFGLIVVLAAWLAGPAKWAVSARRFSAPAMREHAGAVWGGASLAMLLILAWAPFTAMRSVIGAVFFTALAAGGLYALQREVGREFPA